MSLIPGNFTDGAVTVTDDAANSATLGCFSGDFVATVPGNNGRANDLTQAQGAYKGARQGERVPVTLTFTAISNAYDDAFQQMVHGLTAGFTSVTADIGNSVAFDLAFDGSYGAETRTFALEDCFLDTYTLTQGSPSSTVSFSITGIGPANFNGTQYVTSR